MILELSSFDSALKSLTRALEFTYELCWELVDYHRLTVSFQKIIEETGVKLDY